jgi:hypothetical protein
MRLTGVVRKLQKERDRAKTGLARLDAALAALGSLNGSFRGVRPKRRKMSVAGRARIAAAQRARWARVRSQKQVKTNKPKKHWSQLPENKTRVLQLVRRMNRARLAA